MHSYNNAFDIIWNQRDASNPIQIRKEVKQGCPLSRLLFNIYIDTIFDFIMRQENHKYPYSNE
jgi:hypothetical protein